MVRGVKDNIERRAYLRPVLYSSLIGMAVFALGLLFGYLRNQVVEKEVQAETREVLETIAQNMQYVIREINSVALLLAQTVDEDGTVSEFEETSAALLEKYSTVSVLEIIDDGVVTHVYPGEGYEEVLGYDLYQNERIKREIYLTAENGTIYLGGPSRLVEGGLGVIGLLPFYVEDDYIRISAVILYLDVLLAEAQLNAFTDSYYFELSKINLATGVEEFFLNTAPDFDPVTFQSVEIKEGDWTLYAASITPSTGMFVWVLYTGVSILGGLLFGYLAYQIFSKPLELERLLNERTEELFENREQFRKSTELLSSVLESPQNIVIFSLDNAFNYIAFNRNYKALMRRFFKFRVKHGAHVFDGYPPTINEKLKPLLERVLNGESFDYTDEYPDPKGNIHYWQHWFSPVKDNEERIIGVTVFSVDIGQRVRAELELERSLGEKTTLLSEIHHRVKNNLAIVSGLLELQKVEMDDLRLATAFDQSINRIISIAMVHELMYNTDDLSSVDVHAYLEKLIPAISATMQNKAQNVQFALDIEEYRLNINQAIPLGLLLNELITNSFKYAFNGKADNRIDITLSSKNDQVNVSYYENGTGFPEGIEFNAPKNLGLNLIHAQLTQLDATFQAKTDNGFLLDFSFIALGKGSHSNI